MEYYFYIKALHIIFIVCWFSGLFYLVRLFVYYTEAQQKPKEFQAIMLPQYELMIRNLFFIITYPAGTIATLLGMILISLNTVYLSQGWMLLKLFFVLLVWLYHFRCHRYVKQIQERKLTKSSRYFRIWNEGATLLLFSIVFLVVLKNSLQWIYGVVGLVGLALLLMFGIKYYARIRKNK